MSSERLTDKKKRYDAEDAVLIIEGVEYDVLALWGHIEALEQALEAAEQENERLRTAIADALTEDDVIKYVNHKLIGRLEAALEAENGGSDGVGS